MLTANQTSASSYRSYYLSSDISQVMTVVILFQIPNILFAYSDYVLYGISQHLFLMWILRGFILAASLTLCWVLKYLPTVGRYDWLVFGWCLLVGSYIIFVDSTRPSGYFLYALTDMAILVCYYLLLPNRYWLRVTPPIVFTLGCIALLIFLKKPNNPLDVNALVIFFAVINILFYLASAQLNRLRREKYHYMVVQQELNDRLNLLSITDELTNINNRRQTFYLGNCEMERYMRYGRVFTVMMFDLDHFKQINDTYGHRVGDRVLVSFVNYIKQNIRAEDFFGRIGGEEFVLILPETTIAGASNFIQRLEIGNEPIKASIDELNLEYTISIGVTESMPGDTSFEDILYRADEGLYQAKGEGRNRVVIIDCLTGT